MKPFSGTLAGRVPSDEDTGYNLAVRRKGCDVPIYEYRCLDNGHRFEVFQSMSDDAISVCEVCGAAAQRVLFAPAIHFKGTGFHNTDYGTKKRPQSGDAGNASNGGNSDSPASSDSAPSTSPSTSSDSGTSTSGADAPKVKEPAPKETAAKTAEA